MNQQLIFLQQIANQLQFADIDLICLAIKEMKNKPIPIAKVHTGHYIDRVTMHDKNFRAGNIQRLSYIKDSQILENKKVNCEYGRANMPGESLFYGALFTEEIQHNRATAWSETTGMVFETNKNEEYFTLSRWEIIEDFGIYECVFQSENHKPNTRVKESQTIQEEFLNNIAANDSNLINDALEQLKFFSDQFAKRVNRKTPYEYKITASFTNNILNHNQNAGLVWGITYPSVQSALMGQNIALLPSAVHKFLKFKQANVLKAERTANGFRIGDSIAIADGCDENGNLIWKEL